jgi:hypothetical protein
VLPEQASFEDAFTAESYVAIPPAVGDARMAFENPMPNYLELHAKIFSDILLLQAKGLERERVARLTAPRCSILGMDSRMGTLRRMGALRPTPVGKVTPH